MRFFFVCPVHQVSTLDRKHFLFLPKPDGTHVMRLRRFEKKKKFPRAMRAKTLKFLGKNANFITCTELIGFHLKHAEIIEWANRLYAKYLTNLNQFIFSVLILCLRIFKDGNFSWKLVWITISEIRRDHISW